MNTVIVIAEMAVATFLIIAVLLQERSSGTSGLWGGAGGDGGFYQVRRGLERVVFVMTVVFVIAFIGLALLDLVL